MEYLVATVVAFLVAFAVLATGEALHADSSDEHVEPHDGARLGL